MGSTRQIATTVKEAVNSALTNSDFIGNIVQNILCNEVFITKLVDKVVTQFNDKLLKQKEYYEEVIADLSNDYRALEVKLEKQEQYYRRNCVRVFGIQESKNENPEKLVCDVFKNKLKVNVDENCIDRCHRVGKPNFSSDKSRPIIVKFTSYKSRHLVLSNRKNLKGERISIKEDLTKTRLELLTMSSNKIGFKNVWSKDGIIYANIKGVIKRIPNIDFLDNLQI